MATGVVLSAAEGDKMATGSAALNRPTTWPAKAPLSPLRAAEITPAAWESMAEFVAMLVKSLKMSSVLMELAVKASGLLDSISLIVCASCIRSLFEIKMLLLVMRILLSFASILLLMMPTATGEEARWPRIVGIVDMSWSAEVLAWLRFVSEAMAWSDIIVTSVESNRPAATKDTKYIRAIAEIVIFIVVSWSRLESSEFNRTVAVE